MVGIGSGGQEICMAGELPKFQADARHPPDAIPFAGGGPHPCLVLPGGCLIPFSVALP